MTEPDDGPAPLAQLFNGARTSIDYVPFALDDPTIVRALGDAQRRGVRVRIMLEPRPEDDGSFGARERAVLVRLGIEVRDANPDFALTHAKYAIVDGDQLVMLTLNATADALTTRRDFGVVLSSAADVAFAHELFEADWERRPTGAIRPGFVVAPDNANEGLTTLVASAQRRIDLYAEKLMPSPLLDAILAAARRGVDVRILTAPIDRGDHTADLLLSAAREGHLQVRIPRRPRIHAKVLVVDGRTVFMGSENVQDAERARRRELGIIFADPEIAARLASTFDRDWSSPGFSPSGHP